MTPRETPITQSSKKQNMPTNQTEHPQSELLNGQHTVNEELTTKPQSSELFKRYKIDHTPFYANETEEGHFLTMGEYRVSEVFQTDKELHTWMKNTWELTVNVIAAVIEVTKKLDYEQTKRTSNSK